MIIFRSGLYLSDDARKKKNKIIKNIRQHKLQPGVYVITLSANGSDLLDLIPAYMLSENGYKGRDISVLGLAVSKEDAKQVAADIIMDVYAQTGGFDVRGYFS